MGEWLALWVLMLFRKRWPWMWVIGFITLFILPIQSTFFFSQYVSVQEWVKHELAFSINSLWELGGRIAQRIVGLIAGQSKQWEHQNVGKYWTYANENKGRQPITVRWWQAKAFRNVEFWNTIMAGNQRNQNVPYKTMNGTHTTSYPYKPFILTSHSPKLTSRGHWWV